MIVEVVAATVVLFRTAEPLCVAGPCGAGPRPGSISVIVLVSTTAFCSYTDALDNTRFEDCELVATDSGNGSTVVAVVPSALGASNETLGVIDAALAVI
jgi:hypothetical protein